ncbi:PhzF family phenazine biosynthesis protein [Micromonospora sp. NBC_00898]|uniref:PhzF family phenazine biosynthesis protein n=1 Tax=Micromonospora sp. NBC_00898 TaxID=2975981 RepID=UPI00386869B4|nr:PhzF family phenazine biosynthesis protein [Micromonospora sp. NBC_00898]
MRIRVIDAFTDRPFAGNPAAVCLLDTSAWPDEAWMRRVAAERVTSPVPWRLALAGAGAVLRRGVPGGCGIGVGTRHGSTPPAVRWPAFCGVRP